MAKIAKAPAAQVATANLLTDGRVVYLRADGGWSTSIADSDVVTDAANAARIKTASDKAASDNIVVGPYLIEVRVEGGRVIAVGYRESIRAAGPTAETKVA
jgi:hypothetical protein